MPVPSSINDLSTTPGTNSPAGSESPATFDDYMRTFAAFIAQLRDSKASSTDAVLLTGAQTVAGVKTFSSSPVVPDASFALAKLGNIATARILGRVTAASGAIEELTAAQAATLLPARAPIQPVDGTVASSALTVTVNPCSTDFRSATANSGAVSTLGNVAAISLVVPNGATLGASNGVLTRLAVLEINNAGTKEVAVVNLSGGVNLNEQGVISTTALSTGSDSANVVYSTSARTNVAYRLAGFLEYTQATAGTYATQPSLVNGSAAPLAMWLAGYGQTMQTPSRALNTTYTNDTGRPMDVFITVSVASLANVYGQINGVNTWIINADSSLPGQVYLRVSPGDTYRVNSTGTLSFWQERR